ncbi:tRNA pseudouridine(55) synthase TruB [Halomonas denitrificans]|nr:tRNA pseudouridine(55) synthase TruB [Halomonas denitrificans]
MPRSGILLLDKPPGLTSNQALGRAKYLLGLRKAGHTGALDPMATGLLPLCFGEATKVSAFLLDADKGYLAEARLGIATDSGDADGEVVARQDVPALDRGRVEQALDAFRGPIDQVPPMYSALKHKGKRLHELARAGIEVDRPPRRVTISRLDLLDLEGDRLALRVHCSKGTYIRSLAMDLGDRLGCGAHLTALRRERSGPFDLRDAVTMEQLEALDSEAERRALLRAPETALSDLPQVRIDAEGERAIRHGQSVALGVEPADPVRIRHGEVFVGLGRIDEDGRLRPRRLFNPED